MIAIIPARAGSKRIPEKNIKPFLGRPIIEYSIRAALDSGLFSEVMVSTDSEKIAEIARDAGASVPFMRSAANSNDFATTADVVNEVLDKYMEMGVKFSAFAVIYPTAPFVTPELLKQGADHLSRGHDGAFTCVEYSYPIQRALLIDRDNCIRMRQPQFANTRSQDLTKTYHDAGQFYFANVRAFRQSGSLWGPNTAPIICPELTVQDIDNETDWKLAELKYQLADRNDNKSQKKDSRKVAYMNTDYGEFFMIPYTEISPEISEQLRTGRNNTKIRRWMLDTNIISAEKHEAFVSSLDNNPDKAYYAVFVRKENDEPVLIGSLTLSKMSNKNVERGIWLFPEHHGKGYARRFLISLYNELRKMGFERVFTRVLAVNNPSNALEASLGALPVMKLNIPPEFMPAADNLRYYVLAL